MAYRFQKQLELATDQTLVEPNWEGILECVDMIRGGEVPVKEAIKTLQKRYHHTNPHISHHALLLLEACVKNCGRKFVAEIATKEFMEDLKNLVVSNPPELVRTKVLELIQCWTSAFQGIPEYKIVGDTHSLLKMNGFEFPPIDEAKAMFLAESAPDWAEGDNCYRCRVEFGVFTRKHHCRACGQIFCDRCSSKQMLLPQFGIEKKVRVCEACFDAKQAQQPIGKSQTSASLDGKSADEVAQREKELKEAQAKEQEELELALAISQSEAEAKEQERLRNLYQGYNGLNSSTNNKERENSQPIGYTGILPSKVDPPPSSFMGAREDMSLAGMGDEERPFDSILAKYLDRDYWERKRRETEEQQQTVAARATAPPPSELSMSISSGAASQQQQQRHQQQNGNGILGKTIGGTTPMASAAAAAIAVENAFENETLNQLDFAQLEEEQQPVMGMGMGSMTTTFGAGKQQQKQQQMQANNELERSFANLKLVRGESAGADDGGGGALEGEERVAETAQFCRLLRERVDTLNNRMRSNQLRGRSIVNDSAIHSLFSQLTELHGAVLQRMTKIEEQREHYERLQDHLAHFQEARQAVNALREENERERMEKLREEQNRRQALLQQKLEVMRHKKHEKLMNDRYAYIQRFQEQERQIRPQRGQGGVQQQQQSMSPLTVGGGGIGAGTSLGMGGMTMGGGMPMPMMPQHMGIGSPMELVKSSSSNQMPPEIPTSYAAIGSSPTPIHQQLQMPMPLMQPQMPMQQPQFHHQMPMPPHYHQQQQYNNQMPMPIMPYSPALSMPQQQFQPVQHHHQQQQHFPLPQHQQQNQATNGMGTHHPQQQQESQAKGGNSTTAAANEVPEDLLISFD